LSAFKQRVPVELFGRMNFPVITERPYSLSLGPHTFYWFSLEPKPAPVAAGSASGTPSRPATLEVAGHWQQVFDGKSRSALEGLLPDYLRLQRWFAGRNKTIKFVTFKETLPVSVPGAGHAFLTFAQVEYVQGDTEVYLIPLAFATGAEAERVRRDFPAFVVAELNVSRGRQSGVLHDAIGSRAFCEALLGLILRRRRIGGVHGGAEAMRMPMLRRIEDQPGRLEVTARLERNNSLVVYGDKIVLKLFRRLADGVNPELEIGRFLTGKEFSCSPPLAGALEYAGTDDTRCTLAVVNGYIHGSRTAWEYTLDALGRYYDRAVTRVAQGHSAPATPAGAVKLLDQGIPAVISEEIGTYLESARVIGVRAAELHLALASDPDNSDFAPESFTPSYQRALFQSMRNVAVQNLRLLRKQIKTLPPELLAPAQRVAELEPAIIQRLRALFGHRITARRIRIHGDCHLGQMLWTGRDFVFFGFEGDPLAPVSERRIKRSPLRDVAAMMRSFHYAACAGLHQHAARGSILQENLPRFESWARFWNQGVSLAFLRAYVQRLDKSELLPGDETELRVMLQAYLLNQMLGELGCELNSRSDRLQVPLQGILYLAGESASPGAPAA
jgi:maltose alpha-D-glucosyltransferase/alpha-amylase